MRVLIAGSGAREHALAWACARHRGTELICAPGNGGTAALAENVAVAADDVPAMVRLAAEREVDLVVIGPDAAIAAGLADGCAERGIAVFGPTRAAGRVESSKEFTKRLAGTAGIPTAAWQAGGADDRGRLHGFATELGACVVKADGLALGKGVTVCDDAAEARAAIDACLLEGRFGDAGTRVVVEERMRGREVSVFALADGEAVRVLAPASDYKRAHDGDRGPNTGGMGACAPPAALDAAATLDDSLRRFIEPCVAALRDQGTPFRGCLYAGLMLTDAGPRLVEFNARFGDPETQVVLPLLGEDLLDLLTACARGGLAGGTAQALPGAAVGVVVAAAGYPGRVRGGDVITGLEALDGDALLFHAGTRRDPDGTLRTAGGRVLTVVGRGGTLAAARERAYANLGRLRFEGMQHRGDIAGPAGAQAAAAPGGARR
ncbi:MAG: phosphoribosylamine---glycine ligase [Chloroflexota bacterium]|nr:phosphoribosylamine---glycine ligase [Chloroflexota bacterium]